MGMKNKLEDAKLWLSIKKREFSDGMRDTVDWVKDNPAAAAAIVTGLSVTASKTAKIVKTSSERQRRDRDFYDPRTGLHTMTRRKLKDWEMDELEWRYNQGESYNSILRDMGLRR